MNENTNEFCHKCGIICVRNDEVCNDSKKIKDHWYCGRCQLKLKPSAEYKYYIKNLVRKKIK